MKMKTEIWCGYEIRFIEHNGEWWAVAVDVARSLTYRDAFAMTRSLEAEDKGTHRMSTPQRRARDADYFGRRNL